MSDRPTVTSLSEVGGETTLPQHGGARVPVEEREALPKTIGRYRVLRKLGAGGMGIVYAANDPELGRTVAIKLVRERLGGLGAALRERLRREAQALARLSHPNVVSIHDVGVDGDQLFIVMQYVDGAPLDDWIAEHKAERDQIVELYLQAGRGLAAAHAAGLVHRDFKPGNVLIEGVGVAKVTDFGLVRLSHLADEPSDSGSGDALLDSMTRGDVVGTPAYMAPEQFLGGAITPATDQFGFCVSLWEALVGARPFVGRSLAAIRTAVLTGVIEAPPPRAMPRRIARALRRGLSVKASDRFPDMNALLAVLEPPRRWWLAAGAAVALTGGGALAAVMLTGGAAVKNPCAGAAAEMDTVWTPAARARARAALAAAAADQPGLPDEIERSLDDRASRWRTMRIDTCEATKVRHTQPPAVMDRRLECLDRSLEAMRAAVELLGDQGSPGLLLDARPIARSGVDAAGCTAEGAVSATRSKPAPAALQARLATLEAHSDAADYAYVTKLGPALGDELEAAGDVESAAQAWRDVGAAGVAVRNEVAREASRKAAVLAAQAGDDELAARAWADAADRAAGAGDFNGVDDMLSMADAAAARSGRDGIKMLVDVVHGTVAELRGDVDGAIAICQKVKDQADTLYHGVASLQVDNALTCLASSYTAAERWDEAEANERALLALREKTDGPGSNTYVDSQMRIALLQMRRPAEREAGIAAFRTGVDALARLDGAESVSVMDAWSDLALALTEGGTVYDVQGREASAEALALGKKLLQPSDPELARLLEIEGNIIGNHNDPEGSAAAYEQALAIYDQAKDLRHWAQLAYNTADGYRNVGHCDRAVPTFERLVRLADAGDIQRPLGAVARGGLGVCLRLAGKYDDAMTTLTSAVTDLEAFDMPTFAAQYRLEMAEVEWKRGRKAEARKLAQAVKDTLPADSGANQGLRQQADDWYLHPKPGLRGK